MAALLIAAHALIDAVPRLIPVVILAAIDAVAADEVPPLGGPRSWLPRSDSQSRGDNHDTAPAKTFATKPDLAVSVRRFQTKQARANETCPD